MPSLLSYNIQGWEPSADGESDLVNVDFSPFLDAQEMSAQAFENATIVPARLCVPSWVDPSKRPASLERTSTMPYPTTSRPSLQRTLSSDPPARTATSSRSAAAAGRAVRPRSSTERKFARKRAENANYIPRPRNSFIIFRTEFVLRKTGGGESKYGNGDDDESSGTLSKRASEEWHKMSDAEKQPWVERAEQEKREHALKYPDYRYKPIRHSLQRKSSVSSERPSMASLSSNLVDGSNLSVEATASEATASNATDINGVAAFQQLSLQAHSDETSPHGFFQSASTCALPELRMPTPLNASFASPSATLANALMTPPASPPSQTQHIPTAPDHHRAPFIPRLNLGDQSAAREGASTMGGAIPRSPSAPVFPPTTIHPALFASSSDNTSQSQMYLPVRRPGARRISCPPLPSLGQPEAEASKAMEYLAPPVDTSMDTSPMLSAGLGGISPAESDFMGYFPEIPQDTKGFNSDEYLSSLIAQDLAGPAALMPWQSSTDFMVCPFRTDAVRP